MTLIVKLIPPIKCYIINSVRANTRVLPSWKLYRKITDVLKPKGLVIRRLFALLKIKTISVVKSVIINRFLNAKIELTIKSRIGGREQ